MCSNPFENHPFQELQMRWGRKFRCRKCGFSFTWGEDDQEFCEHLRDLQPVEWLARDLVEPVSKE